MEAEWYRKGWVRQIAAQYFWTLRSVVKEHPRLKPCLKRCRHCGIVFLTDFRNAGREDIDCPFGCRNAYRKKRSTQRSTAYYQTAEGKFKKKQLNAHRRKSQIIAEPNVWRQLFFPLSDNYYSRFSLASNVSS